MLSGRIDTCNTSLSVYPDAELPVAVAKSFLVTSSNCLVFSSPTLKGAHLSGKFLIAEVLIKKICSEDG